ncbi:hypothetical protein AAC387_Pa02g2134 [Persea americana]
MEMSLCSKELESSQNVVKCPTVDLFEKSKRKALFFQTGMRGPRHQVSAVAVQRLPDRFVFVDFLVRVRIVRRICTKWRLFPIVLRISDGLLFVYFLETPL